MSVQVGAAPTLFVQVMSAGSPQPPLFVAHSSMSVQVGGAPTLFEQVTNTRSPQSPLFVAHSSTSSHDSSFLIANAACRTGC